MLTTPELASLLEHVTYKPGWEFSIYDGRWEGQHFVIRAELPDSTDPKNITVVDIHSMLPPMETTHQFLTWLAWRLGRIEIHEMREFFKVGGEPWADPHAEFAERDLPVVSSWHLPDLG